MRIKDVKFQLIKEFKDKKLKKPEFLARVLLEEVLFIATVDQVIGDLEITKKQLSQLESAKKRMLSGEPLSYIVGRSAFRGFKLLVSKDVLIPRPETEELIDIVKPYVSNKSICLDIGTGSGAIAIALAKETICKHIYACDTSKRAINIALENVKLTEMQKKVQLFQTDARSKSFTTILTEICREHTSSDLIITANLPYIPSKDIKKLEKNVQSFEPHLALDGGQYGTDVIKDVLLRIMEGVRSTRTHIFFEIESSNVPDLKKFIIEHGLQLNFQKDLSGKIRFLSGKIISQ